MCGCIFKAKRLFLALLLCIGCTAVSNPASAVVCFLPDAEGCGDNGINYTPVICDGTNNFTQELCDVTADNYSSKERHYFCVEEGTGCYVLDYTPCFESTDYDDCPGCLDAPKNEQYNCTTTIQGMTRHVCSDKGISSDERDSRTQYLCREKEYKQEGCDTFDLSEAEKDEKEATGDYICTSCIKDMYTSDYDGNWNRTGDGDTVYSCREKEACEKVESDCTDDEKFVADGTTDEYENICGVCNPKGKCEKIESDCGNDEKFVADGTTDDYDNVCGKCETKTKCTQVASDCTSEQTFVEDSTTDDYNNKCGTCKDPDKKTCAQLELKTESECDSATQNFTKTRADDYGTDCGTCDAKKTCGNLGYKTESECKTSNQKFTAASPAVKDDYGTVCGGCGDKKTCKDLGYSTAAEAGTNQNFIGNNITDDYNTACGTLELKTCKEIDSTYKIAKDCNADENFAGNGTEGKDGPCGKCSLKTCAGISSDYKISTQCTESCYTGFDPNGKNGSDGACGACAAQCPSGYTKDLSSCDKKDGYVLSYEAASCTHSVVCGKCTECKLNDCSNYTYTTLSDLSNTASYEACDLGCNQGKKYRCKEGYEYDSSTKKCVEPPEDCSTYQKSPWVVNGSDNVAKCQKLGFAAPCGAKITCGGVEYIECKTAAECSGGSGGSSNNCTASSYTASVTCSLSYSTDECCSAFSCLGHGCGTGYYKCKFDIPSCAFSSVSIHATDSAGQDHVVVQAGAGTSEKTLNNYKIPGLYTPCEFFASSSSLGKVAGEAVSGQAYTWRCSYTRKIR